MFPLAVLTLQGPKTELVPPPVEVPPPPPPPQPPINRPKTTEPIATNLNFTLLRRNKSLKVLIFAGDFRPKVSENQHQKVPNTDQLEFLRAQLDELGVRMSPPGFPLRILDSLHGTITVWLDHPGFLESLPQHEFGVGVFDHDCNCIASWGLIETVLASHVELTDTVQKAFKKGRSNDSMGHYSVQTYRHGRHVVALVIALEELAEAYLATRNAERETVALKRIGRALAMNQTLQPLAIATAHSLIQALDLAGVLLWANIEGTGNFELEANAGIDRDGAARVKTLRTGREPLFLAEQVVQTAKPVWVDRADRHPLTLEVEAQHFYIPAGAIACLPLRVGQQTIGALELIAKEGDQDFLASRDLHSTIAEHLGLALKSAALFEQVEQMATTDPLTGIANHRRLQEFVATTIQEAKLDTRSVGLIMVDVDHFRRFNEEEGHDSGDEVLKLVAQSLKDNTRLQDVSARYGGEEFTIVLPGMDLPATASVAERIRAMIEKIEYVTKSGNRRHITASLGCASYPESALEPDGLFKAADLALYDAKRSGRNRVSIAGSGQDKANKAS